MQGYWNDPEETSKMLVKHEDGRVWLHTGDMCYIDEKGDIYYRQRLKRVYKISGYLVYPSFIEETYRAMAEIYDCCVIGKEDGGKTMLKLFVVKNKNMLKTMKKLLPKRSSISASRTFPNGACPERSFTLTNSRVLK